MYLIRGVFSVSMDIEDQQAHLGSNSPAVFVTMSPLHPLAHGQPEVMLRFSALQSGLVCQAPGDATLAEGSRLLV